MNFIIENFIDFKQKYDNFEWNLNEIKESSTISSLFSKFTVMKRIMDDLDLNIERDIEMFINRNADLNNAMKELVKNWKSIEIEHSKKYEEFQKKNNNRAIIRDSLTKIQNQINRLEDKIEINDKNIMNIIENESTLIKEHEKIKAIEDKIVKRRESSISNFSNTSDSNLYGHMILEYVYDWDYFDNVRNQVENVKKEYIHSLCKTLNGYDFVRYLKEINDGKENSDLITKFDSLSFTSKTKRKFHNIFPSNELPSSIRGIFSRDLFDIESAKLQENIEIRIKKNSQPFRFHELSPGEQHRNLILLALLFKECPLIIDQPEDHLDFFVKNQLPNILRSQRFKRQLFVVTHFQNIPVIGDADKIFHLEEKISESGKNQAIITEGAFDTLAHKIVKLEGGTKAINQRRRRYQTVIKME